MSELAYSREEIRRAVREALLEALPSPQSQVNTAPPTNCRLMKQLLESAQSNGKTAVAVDLSSDKKVNEFVQDLTKCLKDQHVAGLIGAGRLKFKALTQPGSANSKRVPDRKTSQSITIDSKKSADTAPCNGRIESGVLVESKVLALSKTHQRIEIAKGVILTPLAKDRARQLKIEIVRQ